MHHLSIPAALTLLALSAGAAADSPQEWSGLRERWLSAMQELGVSGMAVVAVRDDRVILRETLGYRDPVQRLPVTPDTAFYIASCTKPFTAMGVLSLVESGKIGLDAPVKRYLPRFELADEELTRSITVRDLLSHAKGISGGPIVWLDAYTGEITEDRFYRLLKTVEVSGSPNYTNVHFTLLGRVIDAVSGTPWKDFLDQRIFEPAGMRSATAYASELYSGNAALPCTTAGGEVRPARTRKTNRTMHAAGGMGASAADLARWLRLNLNRGEIDGVRVIGEDTFAQMVAPQAIMSEGRSMLPSHKREAFGLGWMISKNDQGEKLIEHGGGYVGTGAFITFMPEHGIGVAAVANSGVPLPIVAVSDVYSHILNRDITDPLPRLRQMAKRRQAQMDARKKSFGANPLDAEDALSLSPTAYTGTYSHDDLGTITITTADGQFDVRAGDLPLRMATDGLDRFQVAAEEDSPSSGRFLIDDGKVTGIVVKLFDDMDEITFRRQ